MKFREAFAAAMALTVLFVSVPALLNAQEPGECINPLGGMVSWWPADGTPLDIVAGHTASFSGDATYADGHVGTGAFFFDGASEVLIPHDPAFNLQSFTLSAWVRPTSLGDRVEMIVNRETDGEARQVPYELGLRGTEPPAGAVDIPTGNLVFYIGGISGMPSEHRGWIDARGNAPVNEWTHVALRYSGPTASAYVNGVETRRVTGLSGSVPTAEAPLRIGSRAPEAIVELPQARFNGAIDEVTLFDRALTSDEVMALFRAGSGGQCQLVSVNAASGHFLVAPGSITSAFMPHLTSGAVEIAQSSLPTTLDGITVTTIDAQGQERLAEFFFVAPNQANLYITSETADGPALTIVRRGESIIALGGISVESVAPGIFTVNQTGRGAPAALFARYRGILLTAEGFVFDADAPVGQREPVPLDFGEPEEALYISIYGTGMRGGQQITATLDGEPVPASVVVALEEFLGLDQINIGPIPRSFAGRGLVHLELVMDGQAANVVELSFR